MGGLKNTFTHGLSSPCRKAVCLLPSLIGDRIEEEKKI